MLGVVSAELDNPERQAQLRERLLPADDGADVAALQADADRHRLRLDEIAVMFGSGDLDGPSYMLAKKTAAERLAIVEQRLSGLVRRSATLPLLHTPSPGEAFLAADLATKRAVLQELVTVRIQPSGEIKHRFDPTRIEINWKDM